MVVVLAALLLPSVFCPSTSAQDFAIDWSSIDGGGGTSAGGQFALSGTIGQPDAGTMSGGNFTVDGGFWGVVAVVPAPALSIVRTSTNTVLVSWPASATGFELQQSPSLDPANWSPPAEVVTNNGTNQFILVNPPLGNRFYRLAKL